MDEEAGGSALAASFLMDEEAGVDDAGELVVKLPMYSSSLFEDLASSAPGSPAAGSLWPLDPLVPCREAAAPACDGVGQSPRWGERGWSLPPTAGEPGVPLTLPQRALPPAPLALRLDAPETPTALSCLSLHIHRHNSIQAVAARKKPFQAVADQQTKALPWLPPGSTTGISLCR